jgi:hypothetical protein
MKELSTFVAAAETVASLARRTWGPAGRKPKSSANPLQTTITAVETQAAKVTAAAAGRA